MSKATSLTPQTAFNHTHLHIIVDWVYVVECAAISAYGFFLNVILMKYSGEQISIAPLNLEIEWITFVTISIVLIEWLL